MIAIHICQNNKKPIKKVVSLSESRKSQNDPQQQKALNSNGFFGFSDELKYQKNMASCLQGKQTSDAREGEIIFINIS